MSSIGIGQLLATVVSVDDKPPRQRSGILFLASVLYFVGWATFLWILTLTRLQQPAFLYGDIPNTISWFDSFDGVLISAGFLLPAVIVAVMTLLSSSQLSYWRQANAVTMLLQVIDEAITPSITLSWPSPIAENTPTKIRGIQQMGWQTNGRHYRIWHMLFAMATLTEVCATGLVNLTQRELWIRVDERDAIW